MKGPHTHGGGPTRRGWRERVEPGLYRNHRVECRASETERAGFRCDCRYAAHLPVRGKPGRLSLQALRSTSLKEARAEKASRQLEKQSELLADGRIKVENFFDIWIATATLDDPTKASYRRIYNRDVRPSFGQRRLCEVRPEHIMRWVRELESESESRRAETNKRNPQWIRTRFAVMQSMMRSAVDWGRLDKSPCDRAKLPVCDPRRSGEIDAADDSARVLQHSELKQLYAAATSSDQPLRQRLRHEAWIRAGAELGLRKGEGRGLRWPDIDFERRRVKVQRQIEQLSGNEKHTKGKSTRTLPLTPELANLLSQLRNLELKLGASDPSGYVFAGNKAGRPISSGTPNLWLDSLQRKAGLIDADDQPLIVVHGLRHTCASYLICGGMPLYKVSRFLGHQSVITTEQVYAHLLNHAELDDAVGIFRAGGGAASSILVDRNREANPDSANVIDARAAFARE
jgi:integrase